jgi:zinc/manganese transport system substrate-binding protein/manganese/iron transport system substrate-binding protein
MQTNQKTQLSLLVATALLLLTVSACQTRPESHDDHDETLELPQLSPIATDGTPLKVVATTSIIGDIVQQVGGDAIGLTVLIQPGQDPHSYTPGAQDLATVANADVIFMNGWDLEESLAHDIEEIGEDAIIIPISSGIVPLMAGDEPEDDHGHAGVDPHVWLNPANVEQWVTNTALVLDKLDPANGSTYTSNSATYLAELANLETYATTELARIPPENRAIVSNHDSLAYFAAAYNFTIVGSVIPGASTLAEPSARDLATLIDTMNNNNVCTIFSETSLSDQLGQTIAAELEGCEKVQVIPLYTGSLGPAGSSTDNYLGMFRANVDAIVTGLK